MICNFVTNILILRQYCNSVAHRKVSRILGEENMKVLVILVARDSHQHRVSLEVLVVLQDQAHQDNLEGRAFLAHLLLQLAL